MNPWDFFEARDAARKASIAQANAEDFYVDSSEKYSRAEAAYRMELAKEIVRQRADGQPATIVPDLSRGQENVSSLKLQRDIAAGVLEAAKAGLWRHQSDRKDCAQFIQWSLSVAEGRAAQ